MHFGQFPKDDEFIHTQLRRFLDEISQFALSKFAKQVGQRRDEYAEVKKTFTMNLQVFATSLQLSFLRSSHEDLETNMKTLRF